MDTTKTITHIGLCAGYGGIELGLKRVLPTLRSVALCEIEAFAIANLVAKMEAGLMDAAPIWTDLKTFPWEAFRDRVDVLTGGYPCQPFSSAGKRLGAEDPRHLWPYIAAGIRLMRPKVCFFENVEGHITLGLSSVISDLEELGYKVSWGIFSAAIVGAPHQRKRVFILAHRNDARLQRLWECNPAQGWETPTGYTGSGCVLRPSMADSINSGRREDWKSTEFWTDLPKQPSGHCWTSIEGKTRKITEAWPSRPGESQHAWEPPRVVGNAESGARLRRASGDEGHVAQPDESVGNTADSGCKEGRGAHDSRREAHGSSISNGSGSERRMEQGQWQTESSLGRDAHGTSCGLDYAELCISCDNRTDELRLLGNGVVPATAALAFQTLANSL